MLPKMLKELRIKRGLTQREFAEAFSVAQGTVAMWESGKRQPDLETLQKIAGFYSVSVDFILGRESAPPANANPLDEQLKGIMFALSGGDGELSDDAKRDIIDFYNYKMAQMKKKE